MTISFILGCIIGGISAYFDSVTDIVIQRIIEFIIPGVFVIITVLCFQFIGDGLRDAADPYKQ